MTMAIVVGIYIDDKYDDENGMKKP